jgi:cytidine deaminase
MNITFIIQSCIILTIPVLPHLVVIICKKTHNKNLFSVSQQTHTHTHKMSQQEQKIIDLQALITVAIEQTKKSYCPYSNYPVGCAVLCPDGKIFGGSNIENASYGLTICAERSALAAATSLGYRSFDAIVVATKDGGSCCGNCRQFIREFIAADSVAPIVMVKSDRTITKEFVMETLLPNSFGPENLNIPQPTQKLE